MNENIKSTELEQMRSALNGLKETLKQQQIVNEKIMRQAMSKDYGELKNKYTVTIILGAVIIPLLWLFFGSLGLPVWFGCVTSALILVCITATLYESHRYMSLDIMGGSLTEVAENLVAMKKFDLRWLCFIIPVLIIWIVVYLLELYRIFGSENFIIYLIAAIIGASVGGVCGGLYLKNCHKTIKGILRSIDEVKNS